jgi:hypothetical protein
MPGVGSSRNAALATERGGRRPPNNRTIIHAPGAGRQLQNRPPPSRSRHRDIEGEGEWPSNTRTGRHARGVGGGGEPPMPDPTTVALLPPSNTEHTSPPRHPIPARSTATRGVDDGPLPPSSVTPRVVPVVDFGGNAM